VSRQPHRHEESGFQVRAEISAQPLISIRGIGDRGVGGRGRREMQRQSCPILSRNRQARATPYSFRTHRFFLRPPIPPPPPPTPQHNEVCNAARISWEISARTRTDGASRCAARRPRIIARRSAVYRNAAMPINYRTIGENFIDARRSDMLGNIGEHFPSSVFQIETFYTRGASLMRFLFRVNP